MNKHHRVNRESFFLIEIATGVFEERIYFHIFNKKKFHFFPRKDVPGNQGELGPKKYNL